jgi:hypothetical protein
MALTGGYVPDRRAIAAFAFSMRDNIRLILRDVLLACDQCLLEGTSFALDESPPSTPEQGSDVAQALERRRQELETKVAQLITKHLEADAKDAETSKKQYLSETADREKRPVRWQSLRKTPKKKD